LVGDVVAELVAVGLGGVVWLAVGVGLLAVVAVALGTTWVKVGTG
jgi:hypothetical protein